MGWTKTGTLPATVVTDANVAGVVPSPLTKAAIAALSGLKHKTADALTYASPTGNNSNDGLSAGEAKLTISAAITALPANGGRVIALGGTHTIASALPNKNNVIIEGEGKGVTLLNVTVGNLLAPTTDLFGVKFKDLSIYSNGTSHLINLGTTGGLVDSDFENCTIVLQGNGVSFINLNGSGDFIRNSFPGTDVNRLITHTVPAIKIVNTVGGANENDFRGLIAYGNNCTGAPAIHIEASVTGTYAYDNVFQNITGEQNPGGLLRLLSVQNVDLRNVYDYDSTTNYTADVIYIGKSATSTTKSRNVRASHVGRRGGTLGGGLFDFNAVPAEVDNVILNLSGNSSTTPVVQVPDTAVIFGAQNAGYTGIFARFTGAALFESYGWAPATFRNRYPSADPVSFEEGVAGYAVPTATSQVGAMYTLKKFGDAGGRFMAASSGKQWWGDGSGTSFDTSLERTSAAVLALGLDNSFKTGRRATASRPSAVTAGVGAQFFDTDIKRPIWSDGASWLEAVAPRTGSHPLTGMYHADGYGALDKTGVVDATVTLNAWLAALPDFSKGYLPPGIYLCNVVTSGVILSLLNKIGVSIEASGVIIKTTTATATELFRVDNCPQISIEGLELRVTGTTARITYGLHVTCPSPGSAEVISLRDVRSWAESSSYRNVWDVTSAPGVNQIYSASAAFAAGDVGATITIPDSAMYMSTITAVATLSNTLSGAINASVTSIPLTGAITGAPTPEYYTVKIDNEIILVQTGGTTSTLGTCIRGYAGTTAASHSSGATVSTTRATMVDNLNASGDLYGAGGARITSGGQSILYNGIALGADHPGASNVDIANNSLLRCTAMNCTQAGFRFGNGTNGNVINHALNSCISELSAVGVYINGGSITWTDGPCSNNTIDFKRAAGGAAVTHIKGVRSEESGRFWDDSTGGMASPYVILEAIEIVAFHAADSIPIQHRTGGMISLFGMRVLNNSQGANSNVIFAINGPAGFPAFVTAINVATTASTNPFGQYVSPPLVVRNLINITKVDPTSNAILPSPFGNIFDDGIRVYERTNGPAGMATLVAGTVTVAHTGVTANSRIEAHVQSLGTVSRPQAVGVSARVNSTSFTLKSADATDTSIVYWKLTEPAG